jgi:nucleotide-binding universal stress UspA family protein
VTPESGSDQLVLIAYDGTAAAEGAIREAGQVFAGRRALVLTVWNEGLGFELAEDPAMAGMPAIPIDVRAAQEVDDVIQERAQRTAQRGATLARGAGFSDVEGLAVADEADRSVPETIVRVADERGAQVIVVGAHAKGRLSEVIIGSTSRDVLRRATRPVLVVREAPAS